MSEEAIQLTILGAGQSIGKSCFLLSVHQQHILLDCGSYVGKDTKKALPDFSKLPKNVHVDDITVVLISHFHMDHIGGLLYLTDQLKYKGPILASGPTRAVLPLILVNNRALLSNQAQSQSSISVEKCTNLTKNIREVTVRERIEINSELSVTPHIAGHVLGAVMWEIEVCGHHILYTGDYSGDEGGFIPPYEIPKSLTMHTPLDMLIMECTYGNTDFKSLEDRRKQLVDSITTTIQDGGKVLIPCYGIGYTQELIALIQQVWQEEGLTAPIYYSSQDTKSTLPLFSLFSNWTSKSLSINQEKIQLFHLDYMHSHEPFLLFASQPNMSSGVAKTVFPSLAEDPRNLVIFLGNSPPDSYASAIIKENAKIGENNEIPIKCKRIIIPFSAHPDRQCNSHLIEAVKPGCVVLVHGDKANCTGFIKYYVKHHKESPLFLMPENGKTITYVPEIIQYWISKEDEWELRKRSRQGKEIIGEVREKIIKIQREGEFVDVMNSVILPISEEEWKGRKNESSVLCEYIKGKGLKIKWKEENQMEAMQLIKQYEKKYSVCLDREIEQTKK